MKTEPMELLSAFVSAWVGALDAAVAAAPAPPAALTITKMATAATATTTARPRSPAPGMAVNTANVAPV